MAGPHLLTYTRKINFVLFAADTPPHVHDSECRMAAEKLEQVLEQAFSCGRTDQGRGSEAAAVAYSGKPCQLRTPLQALLRRGLCGGAFHLWVAHCCGCCHVPIQMVLLSPSLQPLQGVVIQQLSR